MAHTKAGGTSKNLRDSNPKYLGIKIAHGAKAHSGAILVRQRGTKVVAGANVGIGKDHTLFSHIDGIAEYGTIRKKNFDGSTTKRKIVNVR